jgi:hypothetical protein
MLHESIKQKQFIIKENEGFRVRMVKHEVLSPKGLFSIELVNETLDRDGSVKDTSSYNYFMTSNELENLAHALTQ